MDGQEVVGRLNAHALLASTERRSLELSQRAACPACGDDPARLEVHVEHSETPYVIERHCEVLHNSIDDHAGMRICLQEQVPE